VDVLFAAFRTETVNNVRTIKEEAMDDKRCETAKRESICKGENSRKKERRISVIGRFIQSDIWSNDPRYLLLATSF
jgi:hypothetical protein